MDDDADRPRKGQFPRRFRSEVVLTSQNATQE
jgi:hypothetical protein